MTDEVTRSYVDLLVNRERELREAQFVATQRAIDKADSALTLRLESMNEVKAQMDALQKTFATLVALDAVEQRLGKLEHAEGFVSGKSAMLWMVVIVILSVLGLILSLFGLMDN